MVIESNTYLWKFWYQNEYKRAKIYCEQPGIIIGIVRRCQEPGVIGEESRILNRAHLQCYGHSE